MWRGGDDYRGVFLVEVVERGGVEGVGVVG